MSIIDKASRADIPEEYELKASEMNTLRMLYKADPEADHGFWHAVTTAYKAGFARGVKSVGGDDPLEFIDLG